MHKVFEWIFEVVGWIQIVISPLLIGLFLGAVIYFSGPSILTAIIAIFVIVIFLILGILWANREWKRDGTMHFMSRIMATPELDKKREEDKGEKNP